MIYSISKTFILLQIYLYLWKERWIWKMLFLSVWILRTSQWLQIIWFLKLTKHISFKALRLLFVMRIVEKKCRDKNQFASLLWHIMLWSMAIFLVQKGYKWILSNVIIVIVSLHYLAIPYIASKTLQEISVTTCQYLSLSSK